MSKMIRFLKNTLKSFGSLIQLYVYLDKKMEVPRRDYNNARAPSHLASYDIPLKEHL